MDRGYEVSAANWEKLKKVYMSRFFSMSLCLKDKNISLFWVWGGHFSHESLKICYKVEGWAKILEYNSVFLSL